MGVKLQDEDLPRIGHRIGVGEDEIHAVLDVESRGSGFDSKGRVVMLFEPHIFYRELTVRSQRDEAVAQGLAYKNWVAGKYPKDSYPRYEKACKINPTAAARACSWGLGQIMGFNHVDAGYDSVFEMIDDFKISEANQLEAMINFIVANHLDDELREHDWRGFARGYNGPNYATHGYHTRLQDRYEWWAKKPDTPWRSLQCTA